MMPERQRALQCQICCRRIAFARCVVGAAAHMMQHKQRLATPNPQQPVQIMDQLWQVSFSLYAEHLLEPKAENTAVAICSVLPGILQVSMLEALMIPCSEVHPELV